MVRILVALLTFVLFTTAAMALEVTEAATAKGIEKQAAVSPGSSFPADVGKVYLLTRVKGAGDTMAEIKHIWYQGSAKMAEVSLKLKSDDWTTYSYVIVDPSQKGAWKVDVIDSSGTVLKSLNFNIE